MVTKSFIEGLGYPCTGAEELTSYPSILGGRVKTLHPSIFGGILARREEAQDLQEMKEYHIPEIDLVIVDLYPFEETVANTKDEKSIIEKIDIGGPSMIRAAAKNFSHVAVIADKKDYGLLEQLLISQQGTLTREQRKELAAKAFEVVAGYDLAIHEYFNPGKTISVSKIVKHLRYGENPHQQAYFEGDWEKIFRQLNGKEISYNNLVDIDAAIQLIGEFEEKPVFAIIKHTNVCGIAARNTTRSACARCVNAPPTVSTPPSSENALTGPSTAGASASTAPPEPKCRRCPVNAPPAQTPPDPSGASPETEPSTTPPGHRRQVRDAEARQPHSRDAVHLREAPARMQRRPAHGQRIDRAVRVRRPRSRRPAREVDRREAAFDHDAADGPVQRLADEQRSPTHREVVHLDVGAPRTATARRSPDRAPPGSSGPRHPRCRSARPRRASRRPSSARAAAPCPAGRGTCSPRRGRDRTGAPRPCAGRTPRGSCARHHRRCRARRRPRPARSLAASIDTTTVPANPADSRRPASRRAASNAPRPFAAPADVGREETMPSVAIRP